MGSYFHFHSQSTSLFFGGWNKLKWNTVDAVPLISRRVEPLPFEHMPQMSSTSSTCDLNSPPIRIRLVAIEEMWPPSESGHGMSRKEREITVCGNGWENQYRPFYGSRESFVECWPTTPWVELRRWFVQGGSAASTSVSTLAKQLVIFTCSRVPETKMIKWNLSWLCCF
jgi:hypothetical protein